MQRNKTGLVAAAVGSLFAFGCGGGSSAFHQGTKAELRKDYDTAFIEFERAVQSQPDNSLYLIHERRARTAASEFHLRQGRRLLKDHRPQDAAGEFEKSLSIDPTNQAAAQELARILAIEAEAKKKREAELQKALKQQVPSAPEEVKLKPFPQEPIAHIRISADARKVFETLGKLGDLNVAFTSDFRPGQNVSLDLTNVKIEDALRILAYQTRTFWKPITSNTILVIPETAANHRDFDEQVVKTIFLTNPITDADRTQITGALKQLLSIQRVIDSKEANAIIVSDTQRKVDAAEKLIRSLDRGKAEILVEVAVMEADRDRIRDLGIEQVPTSPLSGANIAGLGFTATTTVAGTTTAGLPLNQLAHLKASDFSIVLPGAVANALLSDTHSRILQNPEVRTTDGQKATLNIGSRVPFATGSFLPSFSGTTSTTNSVGLLASTQFQYQDVGVKIEITPRVLQDGEVSLHAKIDISAEGPSVTIGGIAQPTFTQRTVEHDIRLKEGEANLLGGIEETDTSQTVSGLPGLSQIPILRYFFSSEHSEITTTEVLVMLTPHVVRLPEAGSAESAQVTVGAPGSSVQLPGPLLGIPANIPAQPPENPQ